MTHLSYAMKNGTKDAKKIATYLAPSNNDNGVLKVIEKYIV